MTKVSIPSKMIAAHRMARNAEESSAKIPFERIKRGETTLDSAKKLYEEARENKTEVEREIADHFQGL